VYGRVKVELKDRKTGKQLHPDFPSRRALMLKLGKKRRREGWREGGREGREMGKQLHPDFPSRRALMLKLGR